MRQIKLTIQKRDTRSKTRARHWRTCPIRTVSLESGEAVKRGCGDKGMIPTDTGWHCFYCGNYIYQTHAPLIALWFHFKIAREYWRAMSRGDTFFINGVPISGGPDHLPGRLLADLAESHPPKWFRYYLIFDEEQFQNYLNNEKTV